MYRICIQPFLDEQVRRSFLEELGIHKNWTVVDMIFREFYTGSDEDLTPQERQIMESLFITQSYVEREIEYSYTSSIGSVNITALQNWRTYLQKYYSYIVSGTHFTNFAVQVTFLFFPLCSKPYGGTYVGPGIGERPKQRGGDQLEIG